MERLCMRPGCDRTAVARLSYDTISCRVWLDAVPERPGPAQEICGLHTSRLTVPRGWMLCDRREHVEAIERPGVPATAVPQAPPVVDAPAVVPDDGGAEHPVDALTTGRVRPRRRVQRRVAEIAPVLAVSANGSSTRGSTCGAAPDVDPVAGPPEPDIESETETETAATDEGLPNGDAPTEDEQADDTGQDVPESLQATSPLLSRAFRATGPQRSALTQTLLNERE